MVAPKFDDEDIVSRALSAAQICFRVRVYSIDVLDVMAACTVPCSVGSEEVRRTQSEGEFRLVYFFLVFYIFLMKPRCRYPYVS
jgi:hypothetical protein